VQMKTLGRRITMTATYGSENYAMRMLPRPNRLSHETNLP
jgi:hypothetical protein